MHASTDTDLPSGKTKILHALILDDDEIIELSCKFIFTHLIQILFLNNGACSGASVLEHSLLHHLLHLHLHQLHLCCTIIIFMIIIISPYFLFKGAVSTE
jgi:hypothetical protein